jgi:CRP-like cAMP-binding protein
MRQVFLSKPWIYHEEPAEIKAAYLRYGRFEKLKRGTVLRLVGGKGCFCLLTKGLGTHSFKNRHGKVEIFSLILPNRALGDIAGITDTPHNSMVQIIRDSEALILDRKAWMDHVAAKSHLMLAFTRSIIAKEESHMEAMIANYTLDVESRLKVFLKVLITSHGHWAHDGWSTVPLRLSGKEYARLVSASRITISKLFSRWIDIGVMEKRGWTLRLHHSLFDNVYDWATLLSTNVPFSQH